MGKQDADYRQRLYVKSVPPAASPEEAKLGTAFKMAVFCLVTPVNPLNLSLPPPPPFPDFNPWLAHISKILNGFFSVLLF